MCTSPIQIVNTFRNPTMKRGVRPICGARNVTMFHRVEVNVIEMCLEVVFIFNRMLPETPLPDASPSILFSRVRGALFQSPLFQISFCEFLFYPAPAFREVGISRRQRPDRVKMIRQQHNRIDFKMPQPFRCNSPFYERAYQNAESAQNAAVNIDNRQSA